VRKVISSLDGKRHETLRALLQWEKGQGIHKPGGVLADPSAAIALLWMRRTLQFLGALMRRVLESDARPVAELAREAYAAELEPYHGWLLKGTFGVALGAMPSRVEFFERLAPRVASPAERVRRCSEQLRESARSAAPRPAPRRAAPPRPAPRRARAPAALPPVSQVRMLDEVIGAMRALFAELDLEDTRTC